jgi:hypothetical protein
MRRVTVSRSTNYVKPRPSVSTVDKRGYRTLVNQTRSLQLQPVLQPKVTFSTTLALKQNNNRPQQRTFFFPKKRKRPSVTTATKELEKPALDKETKPTLLKERFGVSTQEEEPNLEEILNKELGDTPLPEDLLSEDEYRDLAGKAVFQGNHKFFLS